MTADRPFWDGIAERYARQPLGDPEAFERKIAVTRDLMTPTDVLLEVGCGTGSLALRLADRAGEIHGLDLSGEMVRIARRKTEGADVDNVHFHVGPFDDTFTALDPGSVDGLLAFSILHLVPDRGDALRRMHGLMKPGGYFVSSTAVVAEMWLPMGPILWAMRLVGKVPRHIAIFDTDTLLADIEAAGFEDVRLTDVGAKGPVAFVVARKPAEAGPPGA